MVPLAQYKKCVFIIHQHSAGECKIIKFQMLSFSSSLFQQLLPYPSFLTCPTGKNCKGSDLAQSPAYYTVTKMLCEQCSESCFITFLKKSQDPS
jgi:hypothetical protein